MQPQRRQPTRLRRPWDSPGKNTGVGCQCMKVKSESEVAQSCPTLHDPMDCSLPGSSIHGIFQARVLEWVAIAFSITYLNSVLKSRDITLPTKAHIVKAMVFSAVMYGFESWTIKKSVYQKIVAFELLRWRRLLRIPWTARKSNQSILKEITFEYSLEGLMLKLKLQYHSHLTWRDNSLREKTNKQTLMMGKIESKRRKKVPADKMVR